jgi:hypothetical protein
MTSHTLNGRKSPGVRLSNKDIAQLRSGAWLESAGVTAVCLRQQLRRAGGVDTLYTYVPTSINFKFSLIVC